MSYTLDWENKGLRIITKGVFGDGFLEASVAATSDPRFIDAEYAIVDFLDVNEFPVGSETLWEIALSDATAYKSNPNLKLAVLTHSQVMDSLAHMYKMYFELNNKGAAWELKLFDSEKQARKWIAGNTRNKFPLIKPTTKSLERKPRVGW